MLLAGVQYDIAWEDKAANHRLVDRLVADAGLPPETYLVLPELGDTGFSFDLARIVDDRTLPWAQALARRHGLWVQSGFATRGPDGRGRNCAAIVSPAGEVVGTYAKVHPFTYGREGEHYAGGDRLVRRRCGGAVVCPLICYDLRFPELWRAAVLPGDGAGEGAPAEVFTIGASWPEVRQAHWRSLLVARAVENQACVVGVNRIGADPNLRYAGGSVIVAPSGEILAEAADGPAVVRAEVDLDSLRRWRREFPALRDAQPELRGSFPVDGPGGPAPRPRGAATHGGTAPAPGA